MNKKIIVWVGVFVVILVVIFVLMGKDSKKTTNEDITYKTEDVLSTEKNTGEIKEFSMTSFVDMTGGSPKPQYSLKEIIVNKGDLVKLSITVTSGMHDFKIDEYNVYSDTKINEESVIEFVADKTGDFIYYCTKPGHRQNGHWGTLRVI